MSSQRKKDNFPLDNPDIIVVILALVRQDLLTVTQAAISGIIDGEDLDFSSKWVMDEDELVIKGGYIDFGNEYYILQLEIDELTKETLELRGKIKGYYYEELDESIPVRASFERK